MTSERPDLISEEPSDPREEGRTLRRPESADLVCSPSAERPEKSGGFHTSWDGAHQQLGGGGGGGGGADGWQTARVCRVPQRVLVVLKSPVQHMEGEAGGASQARRIHLVFASENESVESCEISSRQMGPLIRPRVPGATKIRRNEEKKTGFGRPDERLRRGASSSPCPGCLLRLRPYRPFRLTIRSVCIGPEPPAFGWLRLGCVQLLQAGRFSALILSSVGLRAGTPARASGGSPKTWRAS